MRLDIPDSYSETLRILADKVEDFTARGGVLNMHSWLCYTPVRASDALFRGWHGCLAGVWMCHAGIQRPELRTKFLRFATFELTPTRFCDLGDDKFADDVERLRQRHFLYMLDATRHDPSLADAPQVWPANGEALTAFALDVAQNNIRWVNVDEGRPVAEDVCPALRKNSETLKRYAL